MNDHASRRFASTILLGVVVAACAPACPGTTPAPMASPTQTAAVTTPSASPAIPSPQESRATPIPAPPSDAPPAAEFVWSATSPKGDLTPTGIVQGPNSQLWVTDPYNHRFAIFTADGAFVEFWGTPGDGNGQFKARPAAMATATAPSRSRPTGSLLRPRRRQPSRPEVRCEAAVREGVGLARFGARAIPRPGRDRGRADARVHVLDDQRGVIETYDANGKVLGSFSAFCGRRPELRLGQTRSALDANGPFYVSTANPSLVQRFDPDGKPTMTYGAPGSGPGEFHEQAGFMSIDAVGRLFVTQGPERGDQPGVLVFGPDGGYLTGWGPIGSSDGQLAFPTGVLVDARGDVYVGDRSSTPNTGPPGPVQTSHCPSSAPTNRGRCDGRAGLMTSVDPVEGRSGPRMPA